jgi:hypothetical protein
MGAPGGFLKPVGFACATREQIKLLRDMHFDEAWTRENLASAEESPALWVDKEANERKTRLRAGQQAAADTYAQALQQNVATKYVLKKVIASMRDNFMGPAKGVKRNDKTCVDLQGHFPMDPTESLPHPFVCRYSIAKTPLGLDAMTGQSTYLYKDGCFCESKWKGLCPFRADQTPMYRDFGFASLDERPVTDGMGGQPSGALCWYWSDNKHPEYGYTSLGNAPAPPPPAGGNGSGGNNGSAGNTTEGSPTAPSPSAPSQDSLMTTPQADASAKEAIAEGL